MVGTSVRACRAAQVARLDEQFAKEVFLPAGRRDPRDGGLILAVAEGRAQVEEVVVRMTAPALEQYRETLA